ncbi:MAG TPA: SprT family zinc-dependent metalloprotease [Roseiarcus sp.]|jgi:predicted metal-dependent hydrolase|nr:SprT family zinc-dependent metalloprotease [Roseiarcus sp.]
MLRLFQSGAPRAQVAHFEIAHSGAVHQIALKRLGSARRFTLRVRAASRDVVLTMPARASLKAAREFAERHAAWIGARLNRLPEPVSFEPSRFAPLRGVDHRIVHCPGARGVVWTLEAESGPAICVAGDLAHVARRVTDFLKREARRDLEAAATRYCAALGVQKRRITLRDTTSRWGSCSSTGALNFSWRLILAPPLVLEYLAAHEVAHLVHMNHSAAFWRVTRRLFPETDRAEAWLKAHGADLHRFGPSAREPR